MKVLVIGGTGNISNEVTKQLIELKYDVTVINRGIRGTHEGVKNLVCDINDKDKLFSLVKDLSFDCVIDMLCYTLEDAKFDYEVFKSRCKQLIVISSVAAYKRPFNECPVPVDSPLWETNDFPYGYRKANIERFLSSKMNEMNITILRPALTFGYGCKNVGALRQNYNSVYRILNDMPLISFGDGLMPMNLSFAPDVANGIVLCALNEATYSKTYNINNGKYQCFDDLYLEIGIYLNKEVTIYHIPSELLVEYSDMFDHIYLEKRHVGYFTMDEFFKDVPEFKPKYDLKKGVKLLVDYFNEEKKLDKDKIDIENELVDLYLDFKNNLIKKNKKGF